LSDAFIHSLQKLAQGVEMFKMSEYESHLVLLVNYSSDPQVKRIKALKNIKGVSSIHLTIRTTDRKRNRNPNIINISETETILPFKFNKEKHKFGASSWDLEKISTRVIIA